MRYLRQYERVADREHLCDTCCDFIHPGEMYGGEVGINLKRKTQRMVVFKYHINPMCDPPDDPVKDYKEIPKSQLEENVELRLAA